MRNNVDGDVTKSYRMNTQFMFECVLCWLQGCGVGSPVIRLRLLAISIIRLQLRLRPSAVLVT